MKFSTRLRKVMTVWAEMRLKHLYRGVGITTMPTGLPYKAKQCKRY